MLKGYKDGEGISDYTKFCVDLRRHMWMDGVETELRRLIWQIAVTGKYISAKIHESNRKLAGFKNIYGEETAGPGPQADHSSRTNSRSPASAGIRLGGAGRRGHDRKGHGKIFHHRQPLEGPLVDTNLSIGTIIGIHNESMMGEGRHTMVVAL